MNNTPSTTHPRRGLASFWGTGPAGRLVLIILIAGLLNACAARQLEDSLAGSTAQRLVSHSIDDLAGQLPADLHDQLAGQTVLLRSHFLADSALRAYADGRMALELASRFDATMTQDPDEADQVFQVFYTSLGTDQGFQGFYVPLGFLPGVAEQTRINLITIEQFHGVAEMYYFVGPSGAEQRGDILHAVVRTDALGLPFITIPLSNVRRH